MMKASELRIGNYVYNKVLKTIININGVYIGSEDVFVYSNTQESYHELKDLNPIPLTEQWLIDFGFHKKEDYNYYKDFVRKGISVEIAQDDDLIVLYRNDIGMNYNVIDFVDYVHDFQNKIYALTGQELTIKN